MPATKVKAFLDEQHVKYATIRHSPAYSAQDIAESAHISGKELAKTVIVTIDGKLAMAVLPASGWINFDRLKKLAGTQNVELATEQHFEDTFPDCELGAMPPFGNLYGMDVYVDTALAGDEQIAFNAGSHTELIQLPFEDFQRLVKPKIVGLTYAD